MGSVTRIVPQRFADAEPALSRRFIHAERPWNFSLTGLVAFVIGTTIGLKIDVVGDLYLLEPLLALLALQCVLSRGPGKGFVGSIFFSFLGAGLLTLCGYVFADLVAANEPWQYLKGWGRVALLILDCAALLVLSAHDRRNIWWVALGMGVGGVAALAVAGVPITQWKLGYAEYIVILVFALAPLFPVPLSLLLILVFGVGCVFADYRSLGGVCIVVVAAMLWRRAGQGRTGRTWLRMTAVAAIAVLALVSLLWFTHDQYAERRQQSNVGRYAGLMVAWSAIGESPWVGYGSWAADEKFGRMFKAEVERIDRDSRGSVGVSRSLLPHSQILQVWIEGGVLGLAFFGLYGVHLVGALRWLAWKRPPFLS